MIGNYQMATQLVVFQVVLSSSELGRPRCRWVDKIKMDLVEVGWVDVDWIGLVQERNKWRALVNVLINLLVP
jgi:predicted small integral membrane protein